VAIRPGASRPQPEPDPSSAVFRRFHAYASPEYLKRFGTPRTIEISDNPPACCSAPRAGYISADRYGPRVGRDSKGPRAPHITINNCAGILRACQRDLGIAMLPDYLVEENAVVKLFSEGRSESRRRLFRLIPEEAQVGRRACRHSATLLVEQGAALELLRRIAARRASRLARR